MSKKKTKSEGKDGEGASVEQKVAEQEQVTSRPAEDVSEPLQTEVSQNTDAESAKKAGALAGALKAIEEGVGFVGDKAPEVASIVFHSVKKGATVAYGASSTFVREAYHTAREYAEKYKHRAEIRRLRSKRDALSARLGSIIYTGFAIDKQSPEKLLTDAEISSLMEQIERLDNEVVAIGEELEQQE